MTSPAKRSPVGESAELAKKFKQEVIRQSTRTRRVPEGMATAKQFIVAPTYVSWDDARAGGKHSSAVLGPGALLSVNSDAVSTLPSAITAVRGAYPDVTFAAGHLLNAELGGDGTTARNLTILTSSANGGYKKFDNNVKHAVERLKKAYGTMNRLGIGVTALTYGIKVDIEVNDAWWGTTYPDNCVSTGVVGTAAVFDEPDVQALLEATFQDENQRPERWEALLAQVEQEMAQVDAFCAQATENGQITNSR